MPTTGSGNAGQRGLNVKRNRLESSRPEEDCGNLLLFRLRLCRFLGCGLGLGFHLDHLDPAVEPAVAADLMARGRLTALRAGARVRVAEEVVSTAKACSTVRMATFRISHS
jgi:hypothetical protein